MSLVSAPWQDVDNKQHDHYNEQYAATDVHGFLLPPQSMGRLVTLVLVVFCVPGTVYEALRFVYHVVRNVAGGIPHLADALACFSQVRSGPGSVAVTRVGYASGQAQAVEE